MGFLARVNDGLQNLVANLGTARDKAAASGYGLVTLTDDLILAAYRGAWLPRKIVDIPAQDSCRKWRDWQASPDQIEAIEAEEKRLGLRAKILDARIKARLFGGAVVFIGTGDQNPADELRPERVGKAGLLYLTVLSRREITAGEIETDPLSPFYGKPKDYQISAAGGRGQVTVHPSRLVTFIGQSVGDDQLAGGLTKGWGDSVLQSTYDAVRNADSTAANIASLVFEAKVDVFRIPDLMGSIADPDYEARLLKRFGVAATAKAINAALILDKEEEYEQKSATFQNLPDVLDRFLQLVSGAADIPTTRLLGQSPAGQNATGESDLRNYYDRLSSEQELVMGPAMAVLDECMIRSALGSRPPEVHYIWASLWQVSDKERAEIGVASANTIKTLVDTGLFPQEALAVAGANMLVERSIMPGLEQAIDDAGGLPDYEAVLAAEREQEAARLQAQQGQQQPVQDAAPRTLYVSRRVLNAAEIIRWAKGQGFASTLAADDLHVTITYSRTPVDWFAMGEAWDNKLKVNAGGARQMEAFGKAKVLLFSSNMLKWRHAEMFELGASWDHPDYQPHITISYEADDVDLSKIEPYQGEIVLGPEIFAEVEEDWQQTIAEA